VVVVVDVVGVVVDVVGVVVDVVGVVVDVVVVVVVVLVVVVPGVVSYSTCEMPLHVGPEPTRVIVTLDVPIPEMT